MIYGYARVSTQNQAEYGESLGVQERAIIGYGMMKGMHTESISMHIEKGISGSVPFAERPEGGKLISALASGDVLIVPKLDRAFRSALDALDVFGKLKALGVQLHIIDLGGDVTSDGISKLVFTILAAVAEGERDRIRERIRDVKQDQKKRGRYLGGIVPWGHEVDASGAVIVAPGYADALAFMKATRANHSLRATADAMKKYGFDISHEKVRQVLEAA